jgi:hypothetical protein
VSPGVWGYCFFTDMQTLTKTTWTLDEKSRARGTFWYLGIEHTIEIVHDRHIKTVGRRCREKTAKSGSVTIARPDGCGMEVVACARFTSKPKTAAKNAVAAYCTN